MLVRISGISAINRRRKTNQTILEYANNKNNNKKNNKNSSKVIPGVLVMIASYGSCVDSRPGVSTQLSDLDFCDIIECKLIVMHIDQDICSI